MADEDVLPKIEEASGKEAPETGEKEPPNAPPAKADETGGKEDPKAPPSKSRKVEWTALVISLVTAGAAVVAIIVQSNATADQLKQANDLAWSYQGAQQCNDYRDQVMKLWELGLTAEQIKSWFAQETGGTLAENQQPGGSGRTGYDDRRDGCGSVESLLTELPKTPPSPAPKSG